MKLSDIISITNSYGKRESPWKMPLRIFTSAKVSPPAVNFTFQHCSSCDEVYDIVGYFEHLQTFFYSSLQDYIIGLFVVNSCHGLHFSSLFWPLG